MGGDVADEPQRGGRAGRDARSSETKPSGVLAGNSLAVWVETLVVDPPGSVSFTANPRTPGALSGCRGLPEPLETEPVRALWPR